MQTCPLTPTITKKAVFINSPYKKSREQQVIEWKSQTLSAFHEVLQPNFIKEDFFFVFSSNIVPRIFSKVDRVLLSHDDLFVDFLKEELRQHIILVCEDDDDDDAFDFTRFNELLQKLPGNQNASLKELKRKVFTFTSTYFLNQYENLEIIIERIIERAKIPFQLVCDIAACVFLDEFITRLVLFEYSQCHGFTATQVNKLKEYTKIIHSDLTTIETYGGGSARCMIAEIFLELKR